MGVPSNRWDQSVGAAQCGTGCEFEGTQKFLKDTMRAERALQTTLEHREVREKNALHSVSDNWLRMGIVAACFARVLMVQWPRLKRVDSIS